MADFGKVSVPLGYPWLSILFFSCADGLPFLRKTTWVVSIWNKWLSTKSVIKDGLATMSEIKGCLVLSTLRNSTRKKAWWKQFPSPTPPKCLWAHGMFVELLLKRNVRKNFTNSFPLLANEETLKLTKQFYPQHFTCFGGMLVRERTSMLFHGHDFVSFSQCCYKGILDACGNIPHTRFIENKTSPLS